MKKPVYILLILFIAIGALTAIRSVVSSRITTSGLELGKIQDETATYKTQNVLLKEKIFSLSSLTQIFEAASKVGFVESKATFAVSGERQLTRGE